MNTKPIKRIVEMLFTLTPDCPAVSISPSEPRGMSLRCAGDNELASDFGRPLNAVSMARLRYLFSGSCTEAAALIRCSHQRGTRKPKGNTGANGTEFMNLFNATILH